MSLKQIIVANGAHASSLTSAKQALCLNAWLCLALLRFSVLLLSTSNCPKPIASRNDHHSWLAIVCVWPKLDITFNLRQVNFYFVSKAPEAHGREFSRLKCYQLNAYQRHKRTGVLADELSGKVMKVIFGRVRPRKMDLIILSCAHKSAPTRSLRPMILVATTGCQNSSDPNRCVAGSLARFLYPSLARTVIVVHDIVFVCT